MTSAVIEARGLRRDFTIRKRIGRFRRQRSVVTAVDGIDLQIEAGEMLGYLGPNGAGKSTTIKMFTGVLWPTAGHLRVCGLVPVTQRRQLARQIGVVFGQRSQLWWDLPLRDSFELARHIWRVPHDEIVRIVNAVDHPDAEALFISCTNLPTYDLIEGLEAVLGKPVLTANQVTMWAALRALGRTAVGGGTLLRRVPATPDTNPGAA